MGRKERVSTGYRKAASVFGCAEGLPMMNLSSPGACFHRCTFCCCFLLCFSHWCRLFIKMDIYIYFMRPQFHWLLCSCLSLLTCQGDRWLLLRGVGNMSRDVRWCSDNRRRGWLPLTPRSWYCLGPRGCIPEANSAYLHFKNLLKYTLKQRRKWNA